jgi:hypothetical protein
MRIWLPVAAMLLAMQALPALADRDPTSGAPLPPRKPSTPSPITDHFYIRASYYVPDARTHLRVDPSFAAPGVTGTPISAENDLGLPNRLHEGRVEFMFRMRERNKVRVDYLQANRSGSKVLSNDVIFNNDTFAAGQLSQSSLNWQMFDITYSYSLYRSDRLEIGAGAGVYLLQIQATSAVPATFQSQTVSAAGPVPLPSLDLAWHIWRGFAFTARGAYLQVRLNGVHGWLADLHEDLQYRWNPNFVTGLGYSAVRTSLERQGGSFPGEFAMSISGPEAFLRFSF